MMSSAAARDVIAAAFEARGQRPSLAELQAAQAVGRFEGRYGDWAAVNNWGALQCHRRPPCGAGCVEHIDHHADGSAYQGCYKTYGTPLEGASDLLHELQRRPGVAAAMRAGNLTRMAAAMRASGYFEAPADAYARRLEDNARSIARDLREPHLARRVSPWPRVLAAAAGVVALAGAVWYEVRR